jgi:hypothetical protein
MPAPDFISPFVIQPTRLGILNAVVLIFSFETFPQATRKSEYQRADSSYWKKSM